MDDAHASRQLASPPLGWVFGDLPAPPRRSPADSSVRRGGGSRRSAGSLASRERWQLIVRGHVQGVGYRQACCRAAVALGVAGWVRNRSDGSVEVQAEGPNQQLLDLRLWCESGPLGALVSEVIPSLMPIAGDDWFEIRR